jgi:hypothetical protein
MLEIIGAGLGRTGTLSLKLALEKLGFVKCYHMLEAFQHPEHVKLWSNAANGSYEWQALFDGYRSAVDWPACHFWRQLSKHYPKAKVILTAREPEDWWKSFSQTILQALLAPPPDNPALAEHMKMTNTIIRDQFFAGRVDDKAHILATYRRHLDDVKREIPASRLLVYQVSEGWEPLCKFLGVKVPAGDFPRTNTTDEFVARMAARRNA